MKYSLRLFWYILRIVLIAVSAFAVLIVAFFVAMDSSNVYVIVSDGMKARATNILIPVQSTDLSKYFTENFIKSQPAAGSSDYSSFTITDFSYKLDVESLWCSPWRNTATVTVVESIPSVSYVKPQGDTGDGEGKKAPEPPPWQRARYKLKCVRSGEYWRIDSMQKLEDLEAEPTASPEPSSYITASPLPTASPSPSPALSSGPAASPSPSAAKQ